ncbi:MAG: hypothetical protein DME91_06425 [Verrucomicrobia bacterium]|nr:MAG: hypothetical protein DME91_06425 [Verrucomicrobiota bacterium]
MLAKASRLSKLFLGGMNSDKSVVARRVCSPIPKRAVFLRRRHPKISQLDFSILPEICVNLCNLWTQ